MYNGDVKTIEVPYDERQPEHQKQLIEKFKTKAQLSQAEQDDLQRMLKEYASRHIEKELKQTQAYKDTYKACKEQEKKDASDSLDCIEKYMTEHLQLVSIRKVSAMAGGKSCYERLLEVAKDYVCEEEISFNQGQVEPGKPMKLSDLFLGDEVYVEEIRDNLRKHDGPTLEEACIKGMNGFLGTVSQISTPKGAKNFTCEKVDPNQKNCTTSSVTELSVSGSTGQSCGPGVPVCQMAYSCIAGEYKGNGNTLCAKNGDAACGTISVEDCIMASKKFEPIKGTNPPGTGASSSSKGKNE